MKLRTISAILVLFPLLAPGQHVISPEKQAEVDRFVESLMSQYHLPGVGLSIVQTNGELSYTRGYGMADIENRVPVNNGTIFLIGSITKSFTATIAIRFLNRVFPELGESVLDVPIRELAPGYNFTMRDRYRSEHTTFRDIMSHRVCTTDDRFPGVWARVYEDSKDLFYRQRYAAESDNCEFRTAYHYNSHMFANVGDIIAFMANSTYEDMLQELLDELDMTNTTLVKVTDDHNNMRGRSVPYIWKDERFQRFNPELLKGGVAMAGTAFILSTPSDMAKYMQFHLNLGRVGNNQIVPEEVMEWFYSNSISYTSPRHILKTHENPNITSDLAYGYTIGLEIRVHDGWIRLGHSGSIPPYESYMSLYPELGIGLFTSFNGAWYSLERVFNKPIVGVHSQLFEILQGIEGQPHENVRKSSTRMIGQRRYESPKPIKNIRTLMTNPNVFINSTDDILGRYGSGLHGNFNITLRNHSSGVAKPYLEYGIWIKGWLDREEGTNNTFILNEYDTDFWMVGWTYGQGMYPAVLEFVDQDTIRLTVNGNPTRANFVRNLELEDLPEIPWDEASC